ncbi:hypothetical protein NQ847_04285 [Acinetobacter baumannii]|nr:hypothetical protein [Acinetobacter baumannii]MDC5122301.1 hypothetical protein [Acinetobacter baumannii]
MNINNALAWGLLFIAQTGFATDCKNIEQEIKDIQTNYESKFQTLKEDSENLEKPDFSTPDLILKFQMDTKWTDKRMVFHTPSFRNKTQRMVFGTPQTTMKDKKMSMDLPTIRMELKKTGEYPEFTCSGFSCTVKWSPIYTKVPELVMERKEWVMGIPETTWKDTEIIMDIPEFFMQEQEWILKIPEFTVKNVEGELKQVEDKAQQIKGTSDMLASNLKEELGNKTGELLSCNIKAVEEQKTSALKMYDLSLQQIDLAISSATSRGLDPTKIPSDSGEINLIAQKNKILNDIDKMQKDFDSAIEQMNKSLKETLEKK